MLTVWLHQGSRGTLLGSLDHGSRTMTGRHYDANLYISLAAVDSETSKSWPYGRFSRMTLPTSHLTSHPRKKAFGTSQCPQMARRRCLIISLGGPTQQCHRVSDDAPDPPAFALMASLEMTLNQVPGSDRSLTYEPLVCRFPSTPVHRWVRSIYGSLHRPHSSGVQLLLIVWWRRRND
jgi:hypothetical protein